MENFVEVLLKSEKKNIFVIFLVVFYLNYFLYLFYMETQFGSKDGHTFVFKMKT